MSQIIALCGSQSAGKSEMARILVEQHGYTRLRFADALKEMLIALGLTREQVDGSEKMVPVPLLGGRTPRHAMQTLGTEWGRELIDGDIWTNALEQRLLSHLLAHKNSRLVIDDLRFPNEVALMKRYRANIVAVRRKSAEKLTPWKRFALAVRMPWLAGMHWSEAYWFRFDTDYELFNERGLEELRGVACQLAISVNLEGKEHSDG